jgi:hypothetical protein
MKAVVALAKRVVETNRENGDALRSRPGGAGKRRPPSAKGLDDARRPLIQTADASRSTSQ